MLLPHGIQLKLHADTWGAGLSCIKGHVRTDNEDYGLCFRVEDKTAIIIGDGLGGLPKGKDAAQNAVMAAASFIAQELGRPESITELQDVALRAITKASKSLAEKGQKEGIERGLRTTLIIVIAGMEEVGFAYIGDGGGKIIRASSGEVLQFLIPQKGDMPNQVTGSLGLDMQGTPVSGSVRRSPGDLILMGTDGVFDRILKEFEKDILRIAIGCKGDLYATTDHVLHQMAECKEKSGYYICDDNMTLALLGDGSQPSPCKGFWQKPLIYLNLVSEEVVP